MKLTCTSVGHQGYPSKFLCLYCHIKNDELKAMWDKKPAPNHAKVMSEQNYKDWGKYRDRSNNLKRAKKNQSQKITTTQKHSHSIVHKPLLDILNGTITKATTHNCMGNSLSILKDFMYPVYDKVEELMSSSKAVIYGKAMHKTLDNLLIYGKWMLEETETTGIV